MYFGFSAISYCAPLWDDLRIQVAFGAELQWTQRGAGREPRAPGPFHAARACPRHQLHAGRATRALRKGREAATGLGGTPISRSTRGGWSHFPSVFHGPNIQKHPPRAYHNWVPGISTIQLGVMALGLSQKNSFKSFTLDGFWWLKTIRMVWHMFCCPPYP